MRRAVISLTLTLNLGLAACSAGAAVSTELAAAAGQRGALGVSDALEALIEEGKDTEADRAYAYKEIRARAAEDTAAGAFARAAVAGRLVQARGLTAAHLLAEVERHALRSRALDPDFRDGAATRLLGSLYVLAPAALLAHGDSEVGLELLEGLVAARPAVIENHLRLAEALLALGDAARAVEPLCRCEAMRSALRRDDARLLDRLMLDAGKPACPTGAPSRADGAPRGAEPSR